VLEALPHALQPGWRLFARDSAVPGLRERGIFPILTRLVLESGAGPFSANAPMTAETAYRIVGSTDGRIHLDMWSTLSAPLGRSNDAQVSWGAAETAVAGRVFAEHTFTRPFAPPGQRRVDAADFAQTQAMLETRPALSGIEPILTLPENARALDSTLELDPVPVSFGIVHTDSNLHTNSLAYLRIFEEAALRRFVALGHGSKVLGSRLEIAYRKPCFAGQEVRIALRAFERDGRLGVVGVLAEPPRAMPSIAEVVAHARTCVRMGFDP